MAFDLTNFLAANAAARNAGAARRRAARLGVATALLPGLDVARAAVVSSAAAAPRATRADTRRVVPDLRKSQQKRDIQAKIRQAGLRADIKEVSTPDQFDSPVLLQCPTAGTRLQQGGTVQVVFAVPVQQAKAGKGGTGAG